MLDLKNTDLFQNTGRLESVQGTMYATLDAFVGELVEIRSKTGETSLAEVIGFDSSLVQIMPFECSQELKQNDLVVGLGRKMRIPVGDALLGRIVNATGQPIDGNGALNCPHETEINFSAPDPLRRPNITTPFVTGTRAIDGLITLGCGQRVGLFAGSGVGKSTLLGDIAKNAESDVNVVALIGERGREVRPFIEQALGPEGLRKSVLIVSTSDQTALSRVRASETAVMIASWFRDQGANVLLMLDSLTRLATAQRELGLLLGEPPTSRGYTPSVFQKMAVLLEQLGSSDRGSITGLLTILVDGDDMNEPVADNARSILDGHIVLNRKLAHKGHYPAIDVLASASRLFTEITSSNHQASALLVRRILATYQEAEDLIQMGAYKKGTLPETDAAISSLPGVNRFLQQALSQPTPFQDSLNQLTEITKHFSLATQPGTIQ